MIIALSILNGTMLFKQKRDVIPIVIDICAFVILTVGLQSSPKWRNLLKNRSIPSKAEGFLDSASLRLK